jgi:predicted permease
LCRAEESAFTFPRHAFRLYREKHAMKTLMRIRSLFRNLLRRSESDRDLDAEVRAHLELLVAEKVLQGLGPADARREARIELGGLEQVKEEVRDARSGAWLDSFLQDLRYGARQLRRNPGFTAIAVLTLALGIGSSTAIFSVVNAVLLHPLDFRDPDQLVLLETWNPRTGATSENISLADFDDWKTQTPSLSGQAALCYWLFNLSGSGDPERLQGARASGEFFDVLGVAPLAGRTFTAADDREGRADLVVLGYGLWQRRFGGRADVIGSHLVLNGVSSTVIGVMPASFRFPDATVELWSPFGHEMDGTPRGSRFLQAVARLGSPGLPQAQAELAAVAKRLEKAYPDTNTNVGVRIVSLKEAVVRESRPMLSILVVAVAFVLLVSCVNSANLALVRSVLRGREIAIRVALGGTRRAVVRQFLVESTLVGLLAGTLALFLAALGARMIVALNPGDLPRLDALRMDYAVFAFAAVVSLASGAAVGMLPALRAYRCALSEQMGELSRSATSGERLFRLRGVLVVVQVALTMVLITGSGLLVRSFLNVMNVDRSFAAEDRLVFRIFPVGERYPDIASENRFVDAVLARAAAIAGVEEVTATTHGPLDASGDTAVRVAPEAAGFSAAAAPTVNYAAVYADYFRRLAIPLLAGRAFDSSDTEAAPPVVILNATLARSLWPGESPLGKRVRFLEEKEDAEWHTVVGVASDVRQFSLEKPDRPTVYAPFTQRRFPWLRWTSIIVRSRLSPAQLVPVIRHEMRSLDPQIPVFEVSSLQQRIAVSLAPRRFALALMLAIAGLSLCLALTGMYGVISHLVAQRRPEIAIRMALGAQRKDVLGLVAGYGAKLVASGIAAGLIAALAASGLLSSQLFGVAPSDPFTFAAVALLLTCVALPACLVPALRACRVDPMAALRHE